MSTPPMDTEPESGSHVRVSSAARVDLPDPDAPTMAVVLPAGMRIVTSWRTSGRAPGAPSASKRSCG